MRWRLGKEPYLQMKKRCSLERKFYGKTGYSLLRYWSICAVITDCSPNVIKNCAFRSFLSQRVGKTVCVSFYILYSVIDPNDARRDETRWCTICFSNDDVCIYPLPSLGKMRMVVNEKLEAELRTFFQAYELFKSFCTFYRFFSSFYTGI